MQKQAGRVHGVDTLLVLAVDDNADVEQRQNEEGAGVGPNLLKTLPEPPPSWLALPFYFLGIVVLAPLWLAMNFGVLCYMLVTGIVERVRGVPR